LPGAIVGGLLLGVIEQFVGEWISAELKLAVALIIIIVLLLIKPSGILGRSSKRRV
jgi:branched-chain amino acid transport system permease protein